MDLEEYRRTSRQTWGEMAPGWKDRREWMSGLFGPVVTWMLDRLDAQPGETVLELAGGLADTGFEAARRVGDGGRLIETDFAPEMLEAARRHGAELGLENVDYRVMDAERMDLDDACVDGVICRWGYMLMADPAAALRETRRVLRDGGRLVFAVWRTPDVNPWSAIPGMTLVQRGHMPAPEPGDPGIFALGDPDRVRELVTGAGFPDPQLEEIAFEFRYADEEDYWQSVIRLAGPLARVINELEQGERDATRQAVAEQVDGFRQPDGSYVMPASTWGVMARK
jgi:SAM-dependent methyltransferase